MLEIELCRICLADSIKMYPIEHTRYHELFEWYTEDTMDMNAELPYSVCYLCNALLNRLYNFLKNMIDTEIYLKETLRNTSKLTYEKVEQLKREMIKKPHNLSKIWLRNSNFIALDTFKGHRPPRELRRYFNYPPIMIEYHKPYEHMKLEDIPEEQELEEINKEGPKETKQAETEENMEVESAKIKEAETENINEAEIEELEAETKELAEAGTEKSKEAETDETKEAETEEKMDVETDPINDKESLPQKSKLPAPELKSPHRTQKESSEHYEEKSQENKDQQKPPEEKFENQPTHTENDSETTADLCEFANDDETISIEEDITLVWSPEIEKDSNIPNMEIIENLNHKLESNFSNMSTKTPDSIDSFLLCAKNYRPPEEITKPSNENVTKNDHNPYVEMDGDYPSQNNLPTTHLEFIKKNIEIEKDTQDKNIKTPDPGKFHNPYLQFIEERIATEEKPKQRRVKTPEPVKYHNPYLQFIEERIPTEDEPPKKSSNTSEQRVKTSDSEKYQNQNYMEIDKQDSNMPSVQQKSTELTAIQLEKNYYSLYLEPVKETPLQISNEPIEVIEKSTPVGSRPNKPILKLINPTTANAPAKIIVTSEPTKYISSYVDFVKDREIEDDGIREHVKESNQEIVSIPPKKIRMRKIKKKSSKKLVLIPPVQEKLQEKIDIQIDDYSSQPNHPTTHLELKKKNIEIDGKLSRSGYSYFDHQKRYHRASILRKTHHPSTKELAKKIKNRAAILRKLKNTGKVQINAVTISNDEAQPPGISHQGSEEEDLIPDEQYDEIVMLANQVDQVMEDGNVAVKIEAVDEEFQGTFEESNEEENLVSDTETFDNKDIMDPNNDSNDITQHGDIKLEVEQNMQIDDQVSECEPYLQERVNVNENTTQKDRGVPSNYEKPDFESNYNEIDALNEQEHYAIRSISQISLMPTVQLERLPIGLIKRNNTKDNVTADDKDQYSCARCDFKTTVKLLLFRHQNVHDLNKPFVCSVCQHRFLSQYHLSRHKVIHDRSNYYCAYCDFKTAMKFVMDKHQNVHNKLTRFLCHWCKRRFRSASHRARHSCTNKHFHICKVCNKSFKHDASYLRHLDKHAGVVPMGFKCNACHESFDSKEKYLYHYKLHARKDSENLIHKCKWCNKGFRHKGNCNKHMKLHEKYVEMVSLETEDKQDMYEKDEEMELNEKETTMEDEKFVCGLCTKSFDTEIELGKHAVEHIL